MFSRFSLPIIFASPEIVPSEALLLKYLARRDFPSTKQLLLTSRLKPGTSKYRLSPLFLRRLLPFVFAPLQLLCPRHRCQRYKPCYFENTANPKNLERSRVQNCEIHAMLFRNKVVQLFLLHHGSTLFSSKDASCDIYNTLPSMAAMADYGVDSNLEPPR